jgi:hypothetical protein
MNLKIDIVNDCYSQLRISGLTVQPSPSNLQLALYRMERMMAELYEQKGLNISYNFQELPSLGDESGVTSGNFLMIASNLALRLVPDFGKDSNVPISQHLINAASASMSGAIGVSVRNNMRMIQPPSRMPTGSGNTFRLMFLNRYSTPVPNAPVGPATNNILQGETLDYREDFSAWLGENTIADYTILVDPMLTLDSDTDNDPIIDYRITAPIQPASVNGPWQIVLISVTDSIGRTLIRLINFQVVTPPVVGS